MTDTLIHLSAPAQDHPCELYGYHWPRPIRTQYHHSKPLYLQKRLYGKIIFGPDFWVCGTCHDSLHATIDWMLGDASQPNPMPGRKVLAKAQQTVDWYQQAKADAAR